MDTANPYELSLDISARLLRIRLWGYWDMATTGRYRNDMGAFLRKARSLGGHFRSFVDLVDYEVQSAEVTAAHQDFLVSLNDLASERTAILVSRTLMKLQAKRITSTRTTRVFDNDAEAIAWLLQA